eukprot:CAMPEP_0115657510 /NCGR_PEP_ID=MMETSP0272-20121206/44723_1 /TAXON_ID=71861 /ORGANISM="Scrippsiella trochoidea, Strain CCMP3099" /LENGTH=123 /DNA_ID=CAMNT_0003095551 /DNA_START=24 /DNA_END=392 /DNA_ORIENTATION=+
MDTILDNEAAASKRKRVRSQAARAIKSPCDDALPIVRPLSGPGSRTGTPGFRTPDTESPLSRKDCHNISLPSLLGVEIGAHGPPLTYSIMNSSGDALLQVNLWRPNTVAANGATEYVGICQPG